MNCEALPAATDVFTPTSPARLTFVERGEVNNKLVNALSTPGKQIIVYGHSGSGKTTLLVNKLHQIYESHMKSRCIKGTTFEQLLLDAFDQLAPYYDTERSASNTSKLSASLGAEYRGIKAKIDSAKETTGSSTQQRILPSQLTPQSLATFMGEAGCCWVLEDFHKINPTEKTQLAQVMKVFMDMADRFRTLRIIAIGAVDSAKQIVEYDYEMKNRVAEIFVPVMTRDEVRQIITKGSELLNFSVDKDIGSEIVDYSNGVAAVCHQLCVNICFAAGITEASAEQRTIDKSILEQAVQSYIEEASDTLKSAFNRAFKKRTGSIYDNGRLVLKALAAGNQDGETHGQILARIKQIHANYPPSNLTHYLRELQKEVRGSLIRCDASSGAFSFSDPIYRAYAMLLFKTSPTVSTRTVTWFTTALSTTLSKAMKAYTIQLGDMLVDEISNSSIDTNAKGSTAEHKD